MAAALGKKDCAAWRDRSKAEKGDAAAKKNEWKEKKAAAEKVSELIKDQPILCGDVSEVVGVLKSYAGHSNINVVIAALNALGALCDRLAKDFAGHAKRLAPTLLEKVRSDKTRVIDALDDCLGRLTKSGALTFDGAVDAAAVFVTAPNPLGRHAALTWIAKAAAHDKPAAVAKKLPELLDLLQPLYEDGAAATRTDALATLVAILRPLDFPTRSTALAKVPPKRRS